MNTQWKVKYKFSQVQTILPNSIPNPDLFRDFTKEEMRTNFIHSCDDGMPRCKGELRYYDILNNKEIKRSDFYEPKEFMCVKAIYTVYEECGDE